MAKSAKIVGKRGANKSAAKPTLRDEADQLRRAGHFARALEVYEAYLKEQPDDYQALLDQGSVLMSLERFADAAQVYSKMVQLKPNETVLSNLGAALIRLGRANEAKVVLDYALEINPKNINARINLGGVLQALGMPKESLQNALEAVSIDPTQPLAFNNLGSALFDLAKFPEAKHAFETAILLDSKNLDAQINIANIESKLSSPQASIEAYRKALSLLPSEAKQRAEAIRFYMSFEYLKQGILPEGWDCYEGGFSNLVPVAGARHPRRNFSVPRWNGEALNGKTLLVWREQGLGDELLFATCLHELEALGGKIIVECDRRLVDTFTRSFPQYTVRAEAFLPEQAMQSPYEDFDLHVPLGSLMKYFRRDIKDFERSGAYIKTDPAKVAKFAERLAPYKEDYRLVGICWRSGKLDPVRNLGYTTLDEWGEVLQTPGFKFVNLQYGDCEAELREAEEKYGVEILRWPDLNLKDDLDDVFALVHCLDAIASVQTAVLVMGGSVGVPTVGVKAGGWTTFGQFSNSPWNSKNKNVQAPQLLEPAIFEMGAMTMLDSLSVPYSSQGRGNLEQRLAGMDAKAMQDLLTQLFERTSITNGIKSDSPCVNEILKTAMVVDYNSTQQFLPKILQSGIVLKGLASHGNRASVCLDIAAAAGREGDWVTMDSALGIAEELDKKQFYLRLPQYAWLSFMDGQLERAEGYAVSAIEKSTPSALIEFQIPRLLAETGHLDQSLEFANEIIRAGLANTNVYSSIAVALFPDNKWEESLEIFRLDPFESKMKINHYYHLVAQVISGGTEGASKLINDFYKMNPLARGMYSNLAITTVNKIGLDAAIMFCQTDRALGRANINTVGLEVLVRKINDPDLMFQEPSFNGLTPEDVSLKGFLYSYLGLYELLFSDKEYAVQLLRKAATFKSSTTDVNANLWLINENPGDVVAKKIREAYRKANYSSYNGLTYLNLALAGAFTRENVSEAILEDKRRRRYANLGFVSFVFERILGLSFR